LNKKLLGVEKKLLKKGRDLLNLLEIEEFDVQEWFDRWKENL
jgi:hypothetical protein